MKRENHFLTNLCMHYHYYMIVDPSHHAVNLHKDNMTDYLQANNKHNCYQKSDPSAIYSYRGTMNCPMQLQCRQGQFGSRQMQDNFLYLDSIAQVLVVLTLNQIYVVSHSIFVIERKG